MISQFNDFTTFFRSTVGNDIFHLELDRFSMSIHESMISKATQNRINP